MRDSQKQSAWNLRKLRRSRRQHVESEDVYAHCRQLDELDRPRRKGEQPTIQPGAKSVASQAELVNQRRDIADLNTLLETPSSKGEHNNLREPEGPDVAEKASKKTKLKLGTAWKSKCGKSTIP